MTNFRIVVTDDDEDDFVLIKEAFDEIGFKHLLDYKQDGKELLAYLDQADKTGDLLPDLILLDINMPKMNGIRALEQIRKESRYHHIPIIIYSTSSSPDQKNTCLQLGAQAFVTKGTTYKKVVSFALSVDRFLKVASEIPDIFAIGGDSK